MEVIVHHAPSLNNLTLDALQGFLVSMEVKKEHLASEALGVLGEVLAPPSSGSGGWGFRVTCVAEMEI